VEVTYATAGHPPAIMIDKDGSAQLLEYDGLPLGVARNSVYPTFRLNAQLDSLLVLYTDGVLEYNHDLLEGERRMLQTPSDIAARRVENSAGAIQDAMFAE
jgi:phosphoserine phosphatase RsbU/P